MLARSAEKLFTGAQIDAADHAALSALAARNDRPIASEIRIAIRNHLAASGPVAS